MKFGTNLRRSIYSPWKDHYLDYAKLKNLLREEDVDSGKKPWTDEDESAFVEELLNVQLEKVNRFQTEHHDKLKNRVAECEAKLDGLVKRDDGEDGRGKGKVDDAERKKTLDETLKELDAISKETSELEKFSRMNFTGALKAAKKHDKRRGNNYRVRPLLQVRLASLPFNSEDYSPLLYRLSTMYTFVRQNLEGKTERMQSVSEMGRLPGTDTYTSHKFFVHPENLLEVKTYILRHLPVLVYTPNTMKVADGGQGDPSITSLYFDNSHFELYNNKIEKSAGASSMRIQWFGKLADKPELVVEKKTMREGDDASIRRMAIKSKYVQSFLAGEYKMEKTVNKIKDRKGVDSQDAKHIEDSTEEIQNFVKQHELQPVVRTNYTRTAFQIPGEDAVRISIDTNLALIREDALDPDRPCRDADDWHRPDIDARGFEYPFNEIRKGEIFRFPYAVLEIKVRSSEKKKRLGWVNELMSSHLVKEAPRFSKFVQGVASLFEDYVNVFPFWTSLLDTDIRRDPDDAFEEEQARRAKRVEDQTAVGSLLGSAPKAFRPSISSPVGKSPQGKSGPSAGQSFSARAEQDLNRQRTIKDTLALSNTTKSASRTGANQGSSETAGEADSDDDGTYGAHNTTAPKSTKHALKDLFPSFSTSKYARSKRGGERDYGGAELPPGVSKPENWIKDAGPLRVEPKVWLANQRTFVKWMHISVLLAVLALGLYNAAAEAVAGQPQDHDGANVFQNGTSGGHETVRRQNKVAMALAGVYTIIAVFTAIWGWAMFMKRSRMIERRSGKDFDNVLGPVIIAGGLIVGLGLNFGFKYRAVMAAKKTLGDDWNGNATGLGWLEHLEL